MTLRPLIDRLGVHDDGSVAREVQLARAETLRAALDEAAARGGGELTEVLRRRYEVRLRRAEGRVEDAEGDAADLEVVRAATAAERRRLIELRDNGTIGDAAFQQVEQELDWRELDLLQLSEES
jgi:monovalent cation/hydrogen antiporter